MADDQVSDLVLPLLLLEKGYRTVYEGEAVATLNRAVSAEREFTRRSRIVLQCLRAMWQMSRILSPRHVGLLVSAIAWYRLLRWLLPVFLCGLLISNIVLASFGIQPYAWFLAVQGILYGLALLGGLTELFRIRIPFVGLPFIFVWINAAAAVALVRFFIGEKAATWQTVRQPQQN